MRFKDISIGSKLLITFGSILLLLVIIATVSWSRFNSTLEDMSDAQYAVTLNKEILQREIDHHIFMATASKFFIEPDVKTMAVQTDHRRCGLGQWLYGEGRQEAIDRFPSIGPLISAIENPHQQLHQAILRINTLAQGQKKESILEEAKAIFDTTARESLAATQKGLNQINSTVSTLADQAEMHLRSTADSGKTIIIVLALVSIGLGLTFSLYISRTISTTTRNLASVTEDLAGGNMQARSNLNQQDEMGKLAYSANSLATSLNMMCTRVHGSSSTINASSDTLNQLSASLFHSTEEMAGNCHTVATAAEEMNANMNAIVAASEQTSTNVSVVAAAAEEMTATITEIASSSENARVITEEAVTEASKASTSVMELGEAAEKINKVTETINEIADQTNLLALNATIEAARAGEAGKGFAVVANEIKDLASQTTEATREIQERIEGVQSSSEQTIAVIGTIADIINNTSEIVSTMATAVEEQAVTSQEISNNVSQASAGMQEITENISQASAVNNDVARDIALLKTEAENVAAGSSDVKELATEMKNNAKALDALLENFNFNKPVFDIGRIKDAHFNWKMRLTAVLSGYTTINPADIPNHHQCEFGKWYDNAPEILTEKQIFKEIDTHHEAVHRLVVEAVELFNQGNSDGADRKVKEFEQVRHKLFAALDDMYVS
ncbi:MAG TPA: methyl-accepting chemotaxis protein [Desulfopila sp.]|nr:methyl-accepting chemotaxis protein [Desulfopila sp.]